MIVHKRERREVVLGEATVHGDPAVALLQVHPGHGLLPPAHAVELRGARGGTSLFCYLVQGDLHLLK